MHKENKILALVGGQVNQGEVLGSHCPHPTGPSGGFQGSVSSVAIYVLFLCETVQRVVRADCSHTFTVALCAYVGVGAHR